MSPLHSKQAAFCPCVTEIHPASFLAIFRGFILTGMNLHLARWTAEQKTGSILSNVRVGGRRLGVACTNAETHLWDQWTRPIAIAGKGSSVGVIWNEGVFVWLQRPSEKKDDQFASQDFFYKLELLPCVVLFCPQVLQFIYISVQTYNTCLYICCCKVVNSKTCIFYTHMFNLTAQINTNSTVCVTFCHG